MKVRVDFFPVTDASVLTYITVQFDNKDLQFQAKEGVQKATVNIYGRITTMTRRMAVSPFEDTVTVDAPTEFLQEYAKQQVHLSEDGAAAAGHLPAERSGQGRGGRQHEQLRGGHYRARAWIRTRLTSSTLILADLMEKVPARSIGTGMFVIGGTKVRPRMDDVFKRDEKMGIYMKLYNLRHRRNHPQAGR